jgi:hypothetical protein
MPVLNYVVFQVQILAYLDNVFDVHALMEDSELKTVALERVGDLEEELGHVSINIKISNWKKLRCSL